MIGLPKAIAPFLPPVCVLGITILVAAVNADTRHPIPIDISPDTTRVDGPLRDDGLIDYAAALNTKLSAGIDVDNNLFVVIADLIPPGRWPDAEHRKRTFRMLGVDMPNDNTDFFVPFDAWIKAAHPDTWSRDGVPDEGELFERLLNEVGVASERADGLIDRVLEEARRARAEADARHEGANAAKQWGKAGEGPWRRAELPLVAAWLEAQEAALAKISGQDERTTYWRPIIADPDEALMVQGDFLFELSFVREMAQALKRKALMQLGENEPTLAFECIQAMKALGRAFADDGFVISQLVGLQIVEQTGDVIPEIATHPEVAAGQAKAMAGALERDVIEFPIRHAITTERLMILDGIQRLHGFAGTTSVLQLVDGAHADPQSDRFRQMLQEHFDRNIALREMNRLYDALVDLSRIDDRQGRARAFEEFNEKEIDVRAARLSERFEAPLDIVRIVAETDEADRSAVFSDVLTDVLVGLLLPVLGSAIDAVDRAMTTETLEVTALRLAAYRLEHGNYPESLDSLAPEYVDRVPRDIFSAGRAAAIHYRLEDARAVVYSVGPNGEDNGGAEGWPDGDIVLELPR